MPSNMQSRLGTIALNSALALGVAGAGASAQDCLPSPLFSGNVVLEPPPTGTFMPWVMGDITVGDFSGDGKADLILGSNYGKLAYYRAGADWWDFDAPVVIPVPWAVPPQWISNTSILALASADFNGDGNRDLVTGDGENSATLPTQRIHVLLGNGDGTFQSPTVWGPITRFVLSFGIADFDGDKHLDLICRGIGMPVTILWGAGDGTFPTFSQVASHDNPVGLAVADIDNDDDNDVVVGGQANGALGAIILRNNGDGTFATEPLTPAWGYAQTFGELNGDGWPDLVYLADTDFNCVVPPAVYVRLNDGAGQFRPHTQYPITTQICLMSLHSNPLVVDLDGDGRDEVCVARRNNCSVVSPNTRDQLLVFHNAGDGSLQQPPMLYHRDSSLFGPDLATADLNGDNRADLISSSQSLTTLLLNDGDGGFVTAHGTSIGPEPPHCGSDISGMLNIWQLTPGDVNNDGRFDLVGIRQDIGNPPAIPGYLDCAVMLQDTQGAFTNVLFTPLPERYTEGLAVADFNRDNNLDIALCASTSDGSEPCGGDSARVAFGDGDGTFQAWAEYHTVGKHPTDVVAGDLNSDDWPDLVVATSSGPSCPSNPQGPLGVSVFLNNGDGTFASSVQYNTGAAQFSGDTSTIIADCDGDGDPDLAVLSRYSGVTILLNNGNGTFGTASPFYGDDPMGLSSFTMGDVNADNAPDIVAGIMYDHYDPPNSAGMSLLLNNGSGTFTPAGVIGAGTPFDTPTLADLNGDGNADLITALAYIDNGAYNIRLGNGDGTFGPAILYGGGFGKPIILDFDGDGRLDLGAPRGCSPSEDNYQYLGFARLLNRMCPAPQPCPADIAPPGGNGNVNIADLLFVIANWGQGAPGGNPADVNNDNIVNIADLLFVISNWGDCP